MMNAKKQHQGLFFNSYLLLKNTFSTSWFPKLRLTSRHIFMLTILILWFSNTFALTLSGATSENRKPGKQMIKPEPFPGEPTYFQGFALFTIPVGNDKATVLCPVNPAEGRPWVIAPSLYDLKSAPVAYITQTELELVKRGFYVVTLDLGNTYGSPDAISKWDALYPIMTQKYGMAQKPALMGLSREGLAIARWAAANKGKVSCLYMDKAVCDFKSWPGGKLGIGKGSEGDWKNLIKLYHFKSEKEALAYHKNPVDLARKLVASKVAIIYVAGETDEAVPYINNGELMEQQYKKWGGTFKLILKKGEGHHPHGLQDQTPVVDFIQLHSGHPLQ
jgi:hypothetical protein